MTKKARRPAEGVERQKARIEGRAVLLGEGRTRANVFPVLVEGIPEELKKKDQWVAWKFARRAGQPKPTKVPVHPTTFEYIDVGDPSNWSAFDTALAATKQEGGKADGIGFALENGYVGIDLDDVMDKDGVLLESADEVVDRLDTYAEESVSGTGVHALAKGKLPPGGRKKKGFRGIPQIEMYDCKRFFVVTGRRLQGVPDSVMDRQKELETLHAEVFGSDSKNLQPLPPSRPVNLPDDVLLDRARKREEWRSLLGVVRPWRPGEVSRRRFERRPGPLLYARLLDWGRRGAHGSPVPPVSPDAREVVARRLSPIERSPRPSKEHPTSTSRAGRGPPSSCRLASMTNRSRRGNSWPSSSPLSSGCCRKSSRKGSPS